MVHEKLKPFECQFCSSKFEAKITSVFMWKQFMNTLSNLNVPFVSQNLDIKAAWKNT
jgi:hypothetical protein